MVVDRLYRTLAHDLKTWAAPKKTQRTENDAAAFLKQRLNVAIDLSKALVFLHKHRILHRYVSIDLVVD